MRKCVKWGGSAAVALAAVFAMSLSAVAQQAGQGDKPVTTSKDAGDSVKVHVSGRVVLDYVYRSYELTTATDNIGALDDGETTFEGFLAVRVDAELSDKVGVVLEVGTFRVSTDHTVPGIQHFGQDDDDDDDDEDNLRLGIREAHLRIGELFMPELSAQLGMPTWNFDVRGRGNAFAFDPRHTQTFERNHRLGQDSAGAILTRGAEPFETRPLGIVLTYKRENIQLDIVALPTMVFEGGGASEDEALYAIDFWYNLDQVGKGSRVGAIVAVTNLGNGFGLTDSEASETSIMTFGGGVVLKGMMDGLEIYGEIYKQTGDAGRIAPAGDTAEADGLAFQVGAEYRLPNNPYNIWFGVNYTMISGDDDITANDEASAFMSYENVNDLMIIEDMYFGMDVDTNYTAIKLSGGLSLSVGAGKNNLEISTMVGIVNTTEDVTDSLGQDVDKLGTEIDVHVRWHLNKQASIHLGAAFLSGSDVLEEGMLDNGNQEEDDSASLYTLGFDVRF